MPQETSNYQFYFDEPRLRMTMAGRALVRVVSVFGYITLIVATFTLLLSYDIHAFLYLGLFLLLIDIDLLVHRGQGDVPISELDIHAHKRGGRVNLTSLLAPKAFSIIERAADRSMVTKKSFSIELTNRLLELDEVQEGLRRLDVKPEEFKQKVAALLADPAPAGAGTKEDYLEKSDMLVRQAFQEALGAGHDFITPPDLFSALIKMNDESLERLFSLFSIDPGDLERALIFSTNARSGFFSKIPSFLGEFASFRAVEHRVMNRAWTSRPTPNLDKYGIDLTDQARNGQIGFLVGHDAEYERMVEALARPEKPNALLVGEAGIGKEAIVHHLAWCLANDNVPKSLFDKRLVCLQLQNLVAGAPAEELHARLKTIVDEIFMAGNVILYIPDIHNMVKTSGTAYLSAADALMPVIQSSDFPVIGASYPREFKAALEPRSDFVGSFEIIPVAEITDAEAEKVLTYQSLLLEKKYKITISFGAVKRAVILSKKYFRNKFLPSSAEDLLKSALIDAERRGEKSLTPERVTAVAEEKVNIPMHEAEGDEAQKLLNMEEMIHKRLVGQDEAVKAVSQALREYRSGLTRKGGPIASFLFVGPTGVGKTELAKILAEVQFGSQKMMVRFDMTEYQDKQSFFRFIGSPDGLVRGTLTDAVLEKPYSLVLLDEFEKAYPDILNLFLQVLDDGRLTDNLGRVVDFTNTIIIATSNAHSDIINDALAKGESMSDIGEYLKSRMSDVFKAELLNRFSKIIVFKNLEPRDLGPIVQLNLQELISAVREQGVSLVFDPAAITKIAKLGYDPAFGARPLRRVIDEHIRAPLSEALLSKKIKKGGRVTVVPTDAGFDFISK